jgi:hypothetical protein
MLREEILIKIRLKLKIQLVDIAYYISDTEDLRNRIYFKEENESDFEESLNDELNLNLDLSSISPLTIDKIAEEIENLKNEENSSKTLDLSVLKLVMG